MSKKTELLFKKQMEEAESKIKQLEHQNTRLEKLRLLPAKGERAKRTHHLCDMGGAIQAISRRRTSCPKRNSIA